MVYHLSDIRQGILQSMVEKQNWVKLFLQSYWDVRLIVFITKEEKRFILLALSLGDIFGPSIIYKLGNSIKYEVGKVEMYIVKAREYSDNVEKEIVNLFVCNGFELIIHYVDFIEKTNRGKQRFLIQELK